MRITRPLAMMLLLSAAPAWGQAPAPEPAPAGTAEGAKALVDGLAPYLSRAAFDTAIVKVEPDPAGYRITVDPKVLLKSFEKLDLRYEASPYTAVVSRRQDGNWNYFSNSPLDVTGTATQSGGTQSLNYDVAGPVFKGVFSPALGAILSGTGSVERFGMKTTDAQSSMDATFARSTYDITGKPAENGAADVSIRQAITNFTEKATILTPGSPSPDGSFGFTVAGAPLKFDATLDAARMRPLLDLYAFFISHPEFSSGEEGRAKRAALQDEFKMRLRAILPLWTRFSGIYDIGGLKIESAGAGATLDRLLVDFGMDGISRAGSIDYRFGIQGLKVASAMIPPWTQPLIPTDLDLDFAVKKLDLQTPVDIVMNDLDLSRDDSQFEAMGAKASTAFEENPPTFVVEPSHIRSRDLDVGFSGSMAFAAGKPSATFTVEAAGLDRTIENLKTTDTDVPEVNQFVGGLSMAKGFGKTLPDGRVQWVIDAASDGSVKINGFEIKGADPVMTPDEEVDGDDSGDEEGIAPDGEAPLDQAPTDDNALPDAAPQ